IARLGSNGQNLAAAGVVADCHSGPLVRLAGHGLGLPDRVGARGIWRLRVEVVVARHEGYDEATITAGLRYSFHMLGRPGQLGLDVSGARWLHLALPVNGDPRH